MVKTRAGITVEGIDPNLHKNPIMLSYLLSFSEINSKCKVC